MDYHQGRKPARPLRVGWARIVPTDRRRRSQVRKALKRTPTVAIVGLVQQLFFILPLSALRPPCSVCSDLACVSAMAGTDAR